MACRFKIELDNGKSCEIKNIDPSKTKVLKLKELIQDKEGIKPSELTLICGGITLHDDKYLSDYEMGGTRSAIIITSVYRRNGGAKNEKLRNPDITHPKIKFKKGEDCLRYAEDDEETIEIKICGCIYAPTSLHSWAVDELKSKSMFKQFECPNCKAKTKSVIWSFDLVACGCGWTDEECNTYYQLYKRKQLNHKEYKSCPFCYAVVYRPQDDSDNTSRSRCGNPKCLSKQNWCWKCCEPWKSNNYMICGNDKCGHELTDKNFNLAKCPTKQFKWGEINCVVPIFRACINSKCNSIWEHHKECNHMTCPLCNTGFCFICLQEWPCIKKYGKHDDNDIAPRQVLKQNE